MINVFGIVIQNYLQTNNLEIILNAYNTLKIHYIYKYIKNGFKHNLSAIFFKSLWLLSVLCWLHCVILNVIVIIVNQYFFVFARPLFIQYNYMIFTLINNLIMQIYIINYKFSILYFTQYNSVIWRVNIVIELK